MTEHDAFLAAICADPHDLTPRLVYADWLTENGEPERGEFIHVQCEMAEIGPPHKKTEGLMAARKDGSGIEVRCEEGMQEGDRVDVKNRNGMGGYTHRTHGLLAVERIYRDGGEDLWLMRRDAKSKPYPKERAEELQRRERELMEERGYGWVDGIFGEGRKTLGHSKGCNHVKCQYRKNSRTTDEVDLYFRRGFIEHVTLSWQDWVTHEKAILAATPITEVTLTDMLYWAWAYAQPEDVHRFLNSMYGDKIKFNLP